MDDFFEVWDLMQQAQLDAGVGTTTAKVLPFKKTTAKVGGTAWQRRNAFNSALIDEGNRMAALPGSGEFATVWEQLIKPTIYDYRQDQEQQEPEETTEELVDRLIAEMSR